MCNLQQTFFKERYAYWQEIGGSGTYADFLYWLVQSAKE